MAKRTPATPRATRTPKVATPAAAPAPVLASVANPAHAKVASMLLASATPGATLANAPATPLPPVLASVATPAGVALPPAPKHAVTVVAPLGVATRNAPLLNGHMHAAGGKLATGNFALPNGSNVLVAAAGNGSKAATVWGQVAIVAKALQVASATGTFTRQALYNALYAHNWAGAGVTPKYTPAQAVAYAGWVATLAAGATGKRFNCAAPAPKA